MLLKAPVRSRISLGPAVVERLRELARGHRLGRRAELVQRAGEAEHREGPEPEPDEARRDQRRQAEGPRPAGQRLECSLPPPQLGRGGLVEAVEHVLELDGGMRMARREGARFHEPPVLVEARADLSQEVLLDGRAEEPLQPLHVDRRGAYPVPEDRQESGILEDGVPPLHPLHGGDVLEEADLQAHCGNHIVHEAPVGFGQLARHDEVPAHESAHHEEQASHSETELISEAHGRHTGTAHAAYKSGAKRVIISRWR